MARTRLQNVKRKIFRFLNIPHEMRNRIYLEVLIRKANKADGKFDICYASSLRRCSEFEEPALIFACRQIRFEARDIFYAENTFTAFCANDAVPFLRHLPRSILTALTSLEISDAKTAKDMWAPEWYETVRVGLQWVNDESREYSLGPEVVKAPLALGLWMDKQVIWVSVKDVDAYELRDAGKWHKHIQKKGSPDVGMGSWERPVRESGP